MYKIFITKTDKNENYEAEMKQWKEGQYGYSRNQMQENYPQLDKTVKFLEAVLTE